MINEQNAVQMIKFMLDNCRQQAFSLKNLLFAITIKKFHDTARRALHIGIIIGDG